MWCAGMAGLPFYDRERELLALEMAWNLPSAQLVTLWGRRRVGKTTLLSHFAAARRGIYLYGTRMAERHVLADLAFQTAEALGEPYLRSAPFPNWESALDYFAARSRNSRLLVVLDEFLYLCDASRGLDTLVQRWWDRIHDSADLMLVLAGSGFSFMEGLSGVRGALHGRRTSQIEVHPFDYFDASRCFLANGAEPAVMDAADRVRAYACIGGVPAYLRYWDPRLDLGANLRQTILSPGHALFREGEELLRTEFHQEALYASILRAVVGGEERPSDIARASGRHSADEIFDHLRRLQELHFLRRDVPVTEIERPRTQRVLYRLADPYLRFWFRYVAPFQSFLQVGDTRAFWDNEIAPTLDEFVARTAWETVCAQYLWRRLAQGRLSVRFANLGRWWDGRDEIDLMGTWQRAITLAGECKWSRSPVDEGTLLALQQKTRGLPLAERPLWVLASRSGFTPALRRRAEQGDLLLLTPADLYAPA